MKIPIPKTVATATFLTELSARMTRYVDSYWTTTNTTYALSSACRRIYNKFYLMYSEDIDSVGGFVTLPALAEEIVSILEINDNDVIPIENVALLPSTGGVIMAAVPEDAVKLKVIYTRAYFIDGANLHYADYEAIMLMSMIAAVEMHMINRTQYDAAPVSTDEEAAAVQDYGAVYQLLLRMYAQYSAENGLHTPAEILNTPRNVSFRDVTDGEAAGQAITYEGKNKIPE